MRTIHNYLALALCFVMPAALVAQTDKPTTMHYAFYDVGTLGGSSSYIFNFDAYGGVFTPSPLNSSGQVVGSSYLGYATNLVGSYLWSQGTITQLPSLPKAVYYAGGSNANGINNAGTAVGASAYGKLSSYNGQNFYHAVSWTSGVVTDLGDLGGGESWANSVNNQGLVIGFADNTIADPYSYYGVQFRATVWQNGAIRDLGTLGGNDAEAWTANDSGQVVGISFLNSNPVPPYNQPQNDAFLWQNGVIIDLGNLGGGFSTPTAINQHGQVTVLSFDASNQHLGSYLWINGNKKVLAGAGGNFVEATTLNDSALITGAATDPTDSTFLAEIWKPSGQGLLLGTVSGDTGSVGLGINNHGVVVGGSGSVSLSGNSYAHAFVWQSGKMQDLNTLIPAGSSLTLNVAYAVNDSGVIAGLGTNSFGYQHVFVLVPQESGDDEPSVSAASAPAAPGSTISLPSALQRARSGPALRDRN